LCTDDKVVELSEPFNLNTSENTFTLSCYDDKHTVNIRRMITLAVKLIPDDWVTEVEVAEIITRAYETVDLIYGIEEANAWAEGFKFPDEVQWLDCIELGKVGWDLEALAIQKNSYGIHNRFSVTRLRELWDKDDPDWLHLLELAAGVPVWLDEDFIPTLVAPPLSPAYREANSVINRLCYEQWVARQAIILPINVLRDTACTKNARVSFSGKYGWVPKQGAREGRPTNNYSYDNKKLGLINSEFVKSAVKEFYGKIELAQLEELMEMILRQVDLVNGDWEQISIWKMDLKGAFALLNFKTSEIGLLSMVLTDNLCFLSLVGNFGLSQYPYIFGVISRVLLRAINKEITGEIKNFR